MGLVEHLSLLLACQYSKRLYAPRWVTAQSSLPCRALSTRSRGGNGAGFQGTHWTRPRVGMNAQTQVFPQDENIPVSKVAVTPSSQDKNAAPTLTLRVPGAFSVFLEN